jgi:histidyl-tRNA synthetase
MAKSIPPPGTSDIFPEEMPLWRRLEETADKVFALYGYGELRTPIFEYTEVFKRGLGNETEVVQKEMYTFEDRGGRSMTLRPENTAGVMRALLNTDVMNGNEKRVYYIGPMFRGERPAAGRKRQFHQVGVENVGRMAPGLDAENIAMLMHYLEELGVKDAELLINTRGNREDRIPAANALKEFFGSRIDSMCKDCQERLEKNIWRILDCKQPECIKQVAEAPVMTSFFSQESKDYFARVCEFLNQLGVNYKVDPGLVRGLDYYVHTVFEVIHPNLGGQNAIAGGGRYELFLPENKKPVIGVGFAVGLERLLMVQEALGVPAPEEANRTVFLVSLGDKALSANMALAAQLRKAGLPVVAEVEAKSMKAQMRAANRLNARYTVIRGEDELAKEIAVLKNMENGEQQEVPVDKLIEFLSK